MHDQVKINSWELIATSLEEIKSFCEELLFSGSYMRSLKKKAGAKSVLLLDLVS